MKAAVLAAKENAELPIIATMSFEANQRTFTGTEVRAMALTLEGLGVDAIGMNCSLGPAEFKPLIEELSKWTTLPIVSKANAGLPNPATGEYDVEAEQFAKLTADLIPHGVKAVGGCCGTTPAFIKAIHEAFEGKNTAGRIRIFQPLSVHQKRRSSSTSRGSSVNELTLQGKRS